MSVICIKFWEVSTGVLVTDKLIENNIACRSMPTLLTGVKRYAGYKNTLAVPGSGLANSVDFCVLSAHPLSAQGPETPPVEALVCDGRYRIEIFCVCEDPTIADALPPQTKSGSFHVATPLSSDDLVNIKTCTDLKVEHRYICDSNIAVMCALTVEEKHLLECSSSQCFGFTGKGIRCRNRRRNLVLGKAWCHHHKSQPNIYRDYVQGVPIEYTPSWWD